MPVKIRLQRHGKKGKPFYWIVAADTRSKRDGRFLEKLGTYNPNTNPASIDISLEDSVRWLEHGAQPTETARRILSYKGVLMKHHLNGGVRKGALTEEQAEKKFQAWLDEKEQKIAQKAEGLEKAMEQARAKALEAEKEVSEKRAQAAAEAEAEEVATAEGAAEEAAAEQGEAQVAEAAETAEATEAPAEDKAEAVEEEAPAEAKAEAAEEAEAPAEEKAEAVAEAKAEAAPEEASEEDASEDKDKA